MRYRRRPKQKSRRNNEREKEEKVLETEEEEKEEKEEQTNVAESDMNQLPPHSRRNNLERQVTVPENLQYVWDADTRRKWLHFCCMQCSCPNKRLIPVSDRYFQTSFDRYYHRRCCHGITDEILQKNGERTTIPLDFTVEYVAEYMVSGAGDVARSDCPEIVTENFLKQLHDNFKKSFESPFYNSDGMPDICSLANTGNSYVTNRQEFLQLEAHSGTTTRLRGAVVLDLFSGLGTGILVLKRLGIDISTAITVEHDKVATYAFKSNHYHGFHLPKDDPDYQHGVTFQDEIKENATTYVHIEKFETLEEDLDNIMEKYGPFDIVLAGPPCSDFSGANSHRQGTRGEKGKYMLRVGELIQKIQRHHQQHEVRVHYMIENVMIYNNTTVPMEETDSAKIENALGQTWPKTDIDAAYFSPCRRLRNFFTNIPLDNFDAEAKASEANPSCCLNLDDNEEDGERGGYRFPYAYFEADPDNPQMIGKALTFMASKTQMDTNRMAVFKKLPKEKGKPGKYQMRHLTAEERAAFMGYPKGYLSPVDELFKTLRATLMDNAILDCLPGQANYDGTDFTHHWETKLQPRYHAFRGNYHGFPDGYRFEIGPLVEEPDGTKVPQIIMQMTPPGRTKDFHKCEEYKKRLVGNAYSIPVVEYLLKPLKKLFKQRNYPLFQYSYCWENSQVVSSPKVENAQDRSTSEAAQVLAEDDMHNTSDSSDDQKPSAKKPRTDLLVPCSPAPELASHNDGGDIYLDVFDEDVVGPPSDDDEDFEYSIEV